MNCRIYICSFVVLVISTGTVFAAESVYDPLKVADGASPEIIDLSVRDKQRQREIPIRVYLARANTAAPVVLFSHGLGGSRKGCSYLGEHWAGRGYTAIFVQHPGSDASIWKDKPPGRRMQALKRAANARNFLLRVKDIPAVLDKLENWNKQKDHILAGRLDLGRVGMSGHSFGARTTQAVSGQRTVRGRALFTDSRIDAALVLSPSSPGRGKPEKVFGDVEIPWMLMTGTKDTVSIGADMESRLAVFPALPPGRKYELLLEGAEHSAFTDRSLPAGDTGKRNPNHHRAILALSTAFWDAWLKDDKSARKWLDGKGPRTVLEKDDRWQTK